jgi:chromosome segregation ATPase
VDAELCILNLCQPELSLDAESLNARLNRLEEQISSGSFVAQPTQCAPVQTSEPKVEAEAVVASEPEAEAEEIPEAEEEDISEAEAEEAEAGEAAAEEASEAAADTAIQGQSMEQMQNTLAQMQQSLADLQKQIEEMQKALAGRQ